MANYPRIGQNFRSLTKAGVDYPVVAVGAQPRTYTGVQSLTVTGTSQTLTVPANTELADIYCESSTGSTTDFVRYWHGGTVPTASVGNKLKDHEIIASADPATFRAILGTGSGTCTLRIEYYYYN